MSDEPELPIPMERTFDGLIGLVPGERGDGWMRATLPVREQLLQPAGLLHGGVFAAVAESLASMGTWVAVAPGGRSAQGLSNTTNFLRPALRGEVHAEAVAVHRGRTTWVWEVRMTDDEDRLCAISRVVIAVRGMPDGSPSSA